MERLASLLIVEDDPGEDAQTNYNISLSTIILYRRYFRKISELCN